jgi:hypothetical protein
MVLIDIGFCFHRQHLPTLEPPLQPSATFPWDSALFSLPPLPTLCLGCSSVYKVFVNYFSYFDFGELSCENFDLNKPVLAFVNFFRCRLYPAHVSI